MSNILITIALKLLQMWIGHLTYDKIVSYVDYLMNDTRSGSEKMNYVVFTVKREVAGITGTAIRAIVEVYLLKLKTFVDKEVDKTLPV